MMRLDMGRRIDDNMHVSAQCPSSPSNSRAVDIEPTYKLRALSFLENFGGLDSPFQHHGPDHFLDTVVSEKGYCNSPQPAGPEFQDAVEYPRLPLWKLAKDILSRKSRMKKMQALIDSDTITLAVVPPCDHTFRREDT